MTLELLPHLAAAYLVLVGLCVGSFLNVVIARVPAGLSVVQPRSRCPRCGHALSWWENIPVLSWLLLRARCHGCGLPISARYPAVELLTGALWLACLWRFGWELELALGLALVTLLVPLALIDAEHWILPFELTLPGVALGLLLSAALGLERLQDALFGAALGFAGFRLMEYLGWKAFGKEALGGGDKYLLALLGAFLTHRSLLGIVFLASLQGALFGIGRLLLTGRAGPATGTPAHAPGGEGDAPPVSEPPGPAPALTWRFLAPGLPLGRRALLLLPSLLFQPIPDEPPVEEGAEEAEWTPDVTNLPFGPWLALAGLEVLLLAPWLREVLPPGLALLTTGGL